MSDFCKLGESASSEPLQFEQLPFNHPLFVMYSSGTTGIPKCMVHSAGVSVLLEFCQTFYTIYDILCFYCFLGGEMVNVVSIACHVFIAHKSGM